MTDIAGAIREGFKLLAQWNKSRDKRYMKAALEAGEKYIQTNEDINLDGLEKKKLLAHYRKRFFRFN